MFQPTLALASLAEALILLPASTLTMWKIYKGSKSNFAYLLVAFTLADVICRLTTFIYSQYPNESVKLPNYYVMITNFYFFNLLSFQSWTFAIKYLWSGKLSSLESNCLSLNCVKWIGWTAGLCYAILMITCWCILMATFPGYTDTKSL
jgi:hypothetical protein